VQAVVGFSSSAWPSDRVPKKLLMGFEERFDTLPQVGVGPTLPINGLGLVRQFDSTPRTAVTKAPWGVQHRRPGIGGQSVGLLHLRAEWSAL
jgi:hypothetical protein